MIFVWSGRGIWIFVVPFLTLGGAAGVIKYLSIPQGETLWTAGIAMALAGLACVALGIQAHLSAPRPALERLTGRELMRKPVHSAYWIRAEYWGLFYLFLGAWMFVSRSA